MKEHTFECQSVGKPVRWKFLPSTNLSTNYSTTTPQIPGQGLRRSVKNVRLREYCKYLIEETSF